MAKQLDTSKDYTWNSKVWLKEYNGQVVKSVKYITGGAYRVTFSDDKTAVTTTTSRLQKVA